MTSLVDSVKLLPWCISSSVLLHYMDDALAPTPRQGGDSPAVQEKPPNPRPPSSPACLMETPPPIVLLLLNITSVGTPPWGTHFSSPLLALHRKNGTILPVAASAIIRVRGPASIPQRHHCGANVIMPELVLEAGPSTEH